MTTRAIAYMGMMLLAAATIWGCTPEADSGDANAGGGDANTASGDPNAAAAATDPNRPTTGPAPKLAFPEGKFTCIFDGNSLAGWKVPEVIGAGKVWLADKQMHLGVGDGITAMTWTGPILKTNYELTMEARRVDGEDFFCGATFPIGDESATLVLGGWGGELVGLSCIDNYDASENSTTSIRQFERNKWYDVRIKVTDTRVVCYVGEDALFTVDRDGRKFSVRWEVEDTVPLGISTWRTHGAIRNVCIRKLLDAEKQW